MNPSFLALPALILGAVAPPQNSETFLLVCKRGILNSCWLLAHQKKHSLQSKAHFILKKARQLKIRPSFSPKGFLTSPDELKLHPSLTFEPPKVLFFFYFKAPKVEFLLAARWPWCGWGWGGRTLRELRLFCRNVGTSLPTSGSSGMCLARIHLLGTGRAVCRLCLKTSSGSHLKGTDNLEILPSSSKPLWVLSLTSACLCLLQSPRCW